jgi:hypothetical protein
MNAVLSNVYTIRIGDKRYVVMQKTFLVNAHQIFVDIHMLDSRAERGISDEDRGF